MTNTGDLVATGNNDFGQCDISTWKNMICVSAGSDYTIGMNDNYEILIQGNNYWIDI